MGRVSASYNWSRRPGGQGPMEQKISEILNLVALGPRGQGMMVVLVLVGWPRWRCVGVGVGVGGVATTRGENGCVRSDYNIFHILTYISL